MPSFSPLLRALLSLGVLRKRGIERDRPRTHTLPRTPSIERGRDRAGDESHPSLSSPWACHGAGAAKMNHHEETQKEGELTIT
jgi:hypothetical protein